MGQYTTKASPIIMLLSSGPNNRLSPLLLRLSPMTNTWPAGILFEEIGLLTRRAVHVQRALVNRHRVAGHRHDALDEVFLAAQGRMKDDHVPAPRLAEMVDHPIEENPISFHQSRLHGYLMDGKRLEQEELDQHRNGESRRHDDNDLDDRTQQRPAMPASLHTGHAGTSTYAVVGDHQSPTPLSPRIPKEKVAHAHRANERRRRGPR
jgi:hypothetical protein